MGKVLKNSFKMIGFMLFTLVIAVFYSLKYILCGKSIIGRITTLGMYSGMIASFAYFPIVFKIMLTNIYINSPGGEVNSGLAIYDLIQSCKAQINMYCIGIATSMGALIFAGGQKGRRLIFPHSKVMIHEPLIPNGVGGSASSIKCTADSILQTRELLNGILAKHSGETLEEINKATDHDNFMTAEEAIEFGLCDEVVTRIGRNDL